MSNSVSNLLESVANTIENRFERISSEDMLHSSKEANKIILELKKAWQETRRRKLRCTSCPYKSEQLNHCHLCKNTLLEMENEAQQEQEQIPHTAGGEQTGHYPSSPCEETMEMHYDCEDCGQEWRCKMEQDCVECGDGIYWKTKTFAY